MCLSPFLVVSLDTATMRIGSLAGSNPRLGDKHRSEEHTSELQSPCNLVCRLLLEKKNNRQQALRRRSVVSHLVVSSRRHGLVQGHLRCAATCSAETVGLPCPRVSFFFF